MSTTAVGYALKAPIADRGQKLTLVMMADSAHTLTGVMWHSVKSLSKMSLCSTRTIQRDIKDLIAAGYIRAGDPSYVAHLRSDRRPTVYEIATSDEQRDYWRSQIHGVSSCHPVDLGTNGVTPEPQRGDTVVVNGVTQLSPKPEEEPEGNHYPLKPPESTVTVGAVVQDISPAKPAEGFDEFWNTYANKQDRPVAIRAWNKALKKPGVTAPLLIKAAAEYVQWCRKDHCIQKYPATWLNAESWENERRNTHEAYDVAASRPNGRASNETLIQPDWVQTDADYEKWMFEETGQRIKIKYAQ